MDANINSKEEKANDVAQLQWVRVNTIRRRHQTEPESPSKGDTVEDLNSERKLENAENCEIVILRQLPYVPNTDVEVASLSTKTKIEVTWLYRCRRMNQKIW